MDEQEQNEPILRERTINEATQIIGVFSAIDNFAPLPPFGHMQIDRMLLEPKVKMGLRFIKGPIISDTRIEIESKNAEIKEYVEKQFRRFLAQGMEIALNCLDRGFSANEPIWERMPNGLYGFRRLNHIDYRYAEPIVKGARVVGIRVKDEALIKGDSLDSQQHQQDVDFSNIQKNTNAKPLFGVKKFWTVHNRHINAIYGRSQLLGAHIPYHELCSMGAIRESINLWFRKCAFDGGIMWVPDGHSKLDGQQVENRVLAQRALDLKRSGGTLVFPSTTDDKNNPLWRYEPPSSGEAPQTLLQWHDTLGRLIWEGLEVPPDLVDSAQAGNSNNKRVIQTAFYTLCTSIAVNILHDFNEQCLQRMVRLNFAKRFAPKDMEYEITKIAVISEMDNLNLQNQMSGLEKKKNNNPFNNGEIGPDIGEKTKSENPIGNPSQGQ